MSATNVTVGKQCSQDTQIFMRARDPLLVGCHRLLALTCPAKSRGAYRTKPYGCKSLAPTCPIRSRDSCKPLLRMSAPSATRRPPKTMSQRRQRDLLHRALFAFFRQGMITVQTTSTCTSPSLSPAREGLLPTLGHARAVSPKDMTWETAANASPRAREAVDPMSVVAILTAAAAATAAAALGKACSDERRSECFAGIGPEYEPGQAVGKGIKAEMWKTKHPQLTILEMGEDTPVLGIMSLVRNVETEGQAFVSAANRLMRQLLDYAFMGLPSKEDEPFKTPAGATMKGVLIEEDVEVCAIALYLDDEPPGAFDEELSAAFPSLEKGSLRVRGLTRGSRRELPQRMAGKRVLLLAPVVGYAQPVLAALERLEHAGVRDEDVTLVSVVISKEAIEILTQEAGDMAVVCGAMDGKTRGIYHQVIPGVGDFSRRYMKAKAVMEAEALERAKREKSLMRRRWWWPWTKND